MSEETRPSPGRSRPEAEASSDARTRVTVTAPDRPPATGVLYEATPQSVGVQFGSEAPARFPAGRQVLLSFEAPGPRKLFEAQALVKWRRYVGSSDDYHRYGFEFVNKEAVTSSVAAQALYLVFNRRGCLRVPPRPDQVVEVRLEAKRLRKEATARMTDLSMTGMGVLVGLDEENALADADHLLASFRLPGSNEALRLKCTIQNRHLEDGTRVRYGLSFDRSQAADTGFRMTRIGDFVAHRLREVLGNAT